MVVSNSPLRPVHRLEVELAVLPEVERAAQPEAGSEIGVVVEYWLDTLSLAAGHDVVEGIGNYERVADVEARALEHRLLAGEYDGSLRDEL